MKSRSLVRTIAALALVLVTAGVSAVSLPGSGMYGTRHDFSGTGFLVPFSGIAVGLCTICHTPHSALTTQLLWNQKLTTATFTWGDVTQTTGGTTLPSSARLGPSTKCLSCHDGTVSVGDTAVYMGSVGGVSDTYPTGTVVSRMGRGGFGIGYRGNMSGNHPIAVPYPLNTAGGSYNGIATGNTVNLNEFVANPDAPAHGIKLYSDDGSGKVNAGTLAGKTGIECTSCHDPHNKAAVDMPFLRGKIRGSTVADGYICVQCHIK